MTQPPNDRLVRAARELLRWDQKTLAKKAKVGVATIRRFETGASVEPRTAQAISGALRRAGVAFISQAEGREGLIEGVALKPSGRPLERPSTRIYKARAAGPAGRLNDEPNE